MIPRKPAIVDPEPPPPPPDLAPEDDLPARPSDPGRHLPADLPDDGGELDVEIIDAAGPMPRRRLTPGEMHAARPLYEPYAIMTIGETDVSFGHR